MVAIGYRYVALNRLVGEIGANVVLGFNYWSPTHHRQVTFHVNVIPFLSLAERNELVGPVRAVIHRYFATKALTKSELNIFESDHVRNLAEQVKPVLGRSVTRYVGVQFNGEFAEPLAVRNQLIAVTSGNAHKRNDLLIRLHRLLGEGNTTREIDILIAGSESQIRQQLSQQDNDYIESVSGIKFIGYLSRDELNNEMSQSLALVTFSEFESFYMVAIEAMTARCPVIATDLSSAAESVGPAGMLVQPGDLASVCRHVTSLLDPTVRQSYVSQGLRWVEQFDAETCHRYIARTIAEEFSEPATTV